jgi:hypothetical protein
LHLMCKQLYKYSLSQRVEAYMLLLNSMNKVKKFVVFLHLHVTVSAGFDMHYCIFTLKLVWRFVFRSYKFNIISLYREMEEACNMSFETCFVKNAIKERKIMLYCVGNIYQYQQCMRSCVFHV